MTLRQGTLWSSMIRTRETALRSGALLPVDTYHAFVEDSGVRFFVRVVASLARKDEERDSISPGKKEGHDPFLPYEKELFVARISDTHIALLNKFNVVDNHLLIVTEDFEDQEEMLNAEDLRALWLCMDEYDGLGFYNGGQEAGASQRHKHIQMVPLPLAPEGPPIPIASLFSGRPGCPAEGSLPGLPFVHYFACLPPDLRGDPMKASEALLHIYMDMMEKAGLHPGEAKAGSRQNGPYCLLVSREWMLMVPRSREYWDSVSVNSLGFAGALLVRNTRQLDMVIKEGPMNILEHVAISAGNKEEKGP